MQMQRVVQLADGELPINNTTIAFDERKENGRCYELHCYGGSFHRVPKDWQIPRCNTMSLWRQWWIGDNILQIPM